MNKKNLILLIARSSGSKFVSRQNLRLVNGKPLIYYSIKKVLEFKNGELVVSTDSEEIKELSESYGANVIRRPKSLIKDSTSLEEVAFDALDRLKKNGKVFQKCLILSPHFPTISTKTIDKFFTQLSNNRETIFGYEDTSDQVYFYAKKISNESNRIIPLENKTLEMKKIISFKCKNFYKNNHFNEPFFCLKIPSNEIFYPKNYHEYGVLENILNKKRILVRVDGDKTMGLGHVYNMLTVLNNLRNQEILIVMNSKKSLGKEKFLEYIYNIVTFRSQEQLFKIIDNFKPDVILNDILNTELIYMKKLKKYARKIINFEDLGNGKKYADLIINPIYYKKNPKKNEFFGSKYACVRDEFRLWQKKSCNTEVSQIVISFGGTDPKNNTLKILNLLYKIKNKEIKIKVIIGIGNNCLNKIETLVKIMKKDGFSVETIKNSDFLAKHISESDFAIISNGRTSFEVASVKVPILAIAVNKRELDHSFVEKSKIGFISILNNKNDEKKVEKLILKMLDYKIRKEHHRNLSKINVLDGVNIVNKLILKEISN